MQDKEVTGQKRKEKNYQMPPEKKSLLSITNNGLINNHLKDNENYNKKHEKIIKIDMIISW